MRSLKYITDFLRNKFPKDQDAMDKKVQASVLVIVRLLTFVWQALLDDGIDRETKVDVPAIDVLDMIQHTICLIGKLIRADFSEAKDNNFVSNRSIMEQIQHREF